ncbi:MAG: hypothetical protein IPK63_18735 [Candidatus Competibacteraceae bacterium]|nr:hypothetical protein [Candidatus Competibacteraceae bacterium]
MIKQIKFGFIAAALVLSSTAIADTYQLTVGWNAPTWNWLRTDETITAHSSLIQGGIIETVSTFLGNVVDPDGTTYTQGYGVEFSVEADATQVIITHRVSTTVSGAVDLGRTDIDHSVIIPVKVL